jgi:lipopolysaccharide transport system ATP-binding protein
VSDTVIRVENLSKSYMITHQQKQSYKTLRDLIASQAKLLTHKLFKADDQSLLKSNSEEFWALKDINFEVKQGQRVGIIGRNGAGKSTLLKILSRITEPTKGKIFIQGRVASLLEVGTGFHPELTGRENIYLNGAVLGMSKAEIKRKFDEIVSFAEVEKFLDTPVKRYSSGMYVRLAFAVAAHLEPEILIVDEVLAVGDFQFQKKCLGKMEDVAKNEGRTVLFVSHQMTAIQQLCSHGLYLQQGSVRCQGDAELVVNEYLSDVKTVIQQSSLRERTDRQGSGKIKVVDFYVIDKNGVQQEVLKSGEDYTFVMEYEKFETSQTFNNVVGSIGLVDKRNEMVFLVRSNFTNQNFNILENRGKIECSVKDFNLAIGSYNSVVFLSHGEAEILDLLTDATEVFVEGGDYFGSGSIGLPSHCKVLTRADWRVK